LFLLFLVCFVFGHLELHWTF